MKHLSGRTVVLVNDFGKSGIDGEIFSADGIESIELPSGCVCCTLKFDLTSTIQKVVSNFTPNQLLIEPSGVASASSVVETLDELNIKPITVVGIIDAAEFVELFESQIYGSFFEDQLRSSDILVINKCDLVDKRLLAETLRLAESINPWAIIYKAVNAEINTQIPQHHGAKGVHKKASSHLNFDTLTFPLQDQVKFESFKMLFKALASGRFGSVARAKALVQTDLGPYRFDLSSSGIQHVSLEHNIAVGRLVIIGNCLKEDIMESSEIIAE